MENVQKLIENSTHQITDENLNKWKVIEVSDLEEIMEAYYQAQLKLLGLQNVSTRLSFEEIGKLADKWLEDEIAKDPKDKFTDIEKYWMLEGFIEGYKKAQKKVQSCK